MYMVDTMMSLLHHSPAAEWQRYHDLAQQVLLCGMFLYVFTTHLCVCTKFNIQVHALVCNVLEDTHVHVVDDNNLMLFMNI